MAETVDMIGRDVYLRINGGPVQHFRAWDVERFIASQVEQGRKGRAKVADAIFGNGKGGGDEYEVTIATRADYLAERRR